MSRAGFEEQRSRRQLLTGAGVVAFAVLGSALLALRAADAKEKKRLGPRPAPRPEPSSDETERIVGQLEKLTHRYVDTIEKLLKEAGRFRPDAPPRKLARELAQLTQAYLTAAAIITHGADDATPALDAQNLHFAAWDANERKQHDKRVANSINAMWAVTSARAVAESYTPTDEWVVERGPKET